MVSLLNILFGSIMPEAASDQTSAQLRSDNWRTYFWSEV
jgi:hypothetical protein